MMNLKKLNKKRKKISKVHEASTVIVKPPPDSIFIIPS